MNLSPTATITVPLQITISVGAPQPAARAPQIQADMGTALASLRANETSIYYDAEQDALNRATYYRDINWEENPGALYEALATLLKETHSTRPRYKPVVELYPWIDLHPDRRIRSVYSGIPYEAQEFIQRDLAIEADRNARLHEMLAAEGMTAASLAADLDALEDAMPFNCEHVVPQSWFAKREPMRGDLHHLFACESGCNSFRSNIPYFDFEPVREAVRHQCGRRETDKFEPQSGHGAIARATLYFLLRYPGLIGDKAGELAAARLETLLRWHRAAPPDEYEHHRNQTIFARQGNRNPLIDFPLEAAGAAFANGFGRF